MVYCFYLKAILLMLQIVQGSVSDLFRKYSLKELAHKSHSFCKSVYTDYAVFLIHKKNIYFLNK